MGSEPWGLSAWKPMIVCHQDEFRRRSQLNAAAALRNSSRTIRVTKVCLVRSDCPNTGWKCPSKESAAFYFPILPLRSVAFSSGSLVCSGPESQVPHQNAGTLRTAQRLLAVFGASVWLASGRDGLRTPFALTRVATRSENHHLISHFHRLQYGGVFSITIMSSGRNDGADWSSVQPARLH